jgi:hypothetical protein
MTDDTAETIGDIIRVVDDFIEVFDLPDQLSCIAQLASSSILASTTKKKWSDVRSCVRQNVERYSSRRDSQSATIGVSLDEMSKGFRGMLEVSESSPVLHLRVQ